MFSPDKAPKDCYLMLLDAARAPSFGTFLEGMQMVNAIEPATFEVMMNIPLPYWTHHASLGDSVILDQVTSHGTELNSGVLSDEARSLSIVELLEHMARFTSGQFAERESERPGRSYAYTKFASDTYEQELYYGDRLEAHAIGYSMYVVKDPSCAMAPNRVNMIFRDQNGPHCVCTCAFPARFRIPCRHVFAAAKVIARVEDCIQFMDEDYGMANFTSLCSDRPGRIVRPTLSESEQDLELTSFPGKAILSDS